MPPQSRVSRKQQQEERRARVAAARAQAAKRRRQANLAVIGGSLLIAVIVLALVGATLYHRDHKKASTATANPSASATASGLSNGAISPPEPTATTTATAAAPAASAAKTSIAGVVTYAKVVNSTTASRVRYAQAPPVGGPHNATVLNCGIYDAAVPNEYAVTDLAHGAVWITYEPTLPTAQINTLETLVNSFGAAGNYVTLSPYTGQTTPVIATAWGVQLKLTSVSDPRLKTFVTTYREYAKAPVPGGTCSGGVGEPEGTVSANGEPATPTASAIPEATTS